MSYGTLRYFSQRIKRYDISVNTSNHLKNYIDSEVMRSRKINMRNIKNLALNFICLLFICYGTLLAWQYQTTSTPYSTSDYSTFYQNLRNTQNIYQTYNFAQILSKKVVNDKPQLTTTRPTQTVNLNTPLMSLFLKGLVNVSNELSINVAAWLIVSLACAAAGVGILLSTTGSTQTARLFLPLLLIFLLNGFSLDTVTAGQISFFIFPILCLAYRFCYQNNSTALAITLGLLGAIKLFFLIFLIYFVTKKTWRPLLIMTLSFLIFFCLPLLYFNTSTYLHFFSLTHNYFAFINRSAMSRNGSLLGFISKLTYFFNSAITELQLRSVAYAMVIYFIFRSMTYDYRVLQKLPAFSEELRFGFYIIIGLICSPLAWIYYFVFLTIPIVVFYKINQRYQTGITFHLCFFLGLTLTAISYTSLDIDKAQWLLYIRQFSTFIALLCWLIALLICVSRIKQNQYRIEKPGNHLLLIYIIASLFSIGYCQRYSPQSYFITWNKAHFLKYAREIIEIQTKTVDTPTKWD